MRILIGADTYPPDVNGASRFTQRLAHGLRDRGHDVHIICPADAEPRQSWRRRLPPVVRDGITEHRVRSHAWMFNRGFQVSLPWEIVRHVSDVVDDIEPDIIHLQGHFVVGRCLVRAARQHDIPVVATNHLMPENLLDQARIPRWARSYCGRVIWRDIGRIYGQAVTVTAPTPRAVDLLLASSSLTDARAVSCGIDASRYAHAAATAVHGDELSVLFVGRLDPEKRVGELIDAFARIASTTTARLDIVGDGTMREPWQQRAEELGIADRVTFHGFVDDADLLTAYGRCDVFVMPGVAELQSLVTLEAMSAGKPIVAANAMALPHLVPLGRNGWLYRPGDVDELAGRLSTLLGDPALRARMGAASREIVQAHTLAATLSIFEDIYAEALGGAAERRAA